MDLINAKKCTLPHIGEIWMPKNEPCDIWFNWEQNAREVMLKKINGNTCFLDLGANFGYFSLYASDKAKKVMSVEPNPIVYDILRCNSLRFPNMTTYNIALSDMVNNSKFYYRIDAAGDGRLYNPNDCGEGNTYMAENVPVETLSSFQDKYCPNIGINLIKMDCEGSEYEILKDLEFFERKENKGCEVILELHSTIIKSRGLDCVELAKRLKSNFDLRFLDGSPCNPYNVADTCGILMKYL